MRNSDALITVYPSKKRMALIAVGGMVFVLIGSVFVMQVGLVVKLIGTSCAIFFGSCTVYALIRLCSSKESCRIDQNGLYENASAASAGYIKWEEVKEVAIYHYAGQRYLGIELFDVKGFIRRQSLLKRLMLTINLWMPWLRTPINVPEKLVSVSLEEIQREVYRYLKEND
ncbi:hypothetical protein JCM19047_2682 [Bacillus sp. JCM 19047]|nr:hypothetical protein JCM19047_2682 [Bacillus sp. JCM 19047]